MKYCMEKEKITVATLGKKILDELVKSIVVKNATLSKSGKSYNELNSHQALLSIFDYLENTHIEPYKIMEMQVNKFNAVRFKDESLEDNRWFVLNTRNVISPNIIIYNMKSGEIQYRKVRERYI